MKARITKEQIGEFRPFDMIIHFETPYDVKLLHDVFLTSSCLVNVREVLDRHMIVYDYNDIEEWPGNPLKVKITKNAEKGKLYKDFADLLIEYFTKLEEHLIKLTNTSKEKL